MEDTVVAVIPARSGSKGIPLKNIIDLGGKPLIAYSIEAGLQSKQIDRVIVSTDSKKIADIAVSFGAEVPFLRPENLASDSTPDLPVFQHALQYLKEKEQYEPRYLVNLRPTCPLRSVDDIDNAIKKIKKTDCDSVRTIMKVHQHPYWMVTQQNDVIVDFMEDIDKDVYYQRQLLPDVFIINGNVDVMKTINILEKNSLYGTDIRGLVVPSLRSIDIDTELDLKLAETVLQHGGKNEKK